MRSCEFRRRLTRTLMRLIIALNLACLPGYVAFAQTQTPEPTTVIVFDGSGSMWGQLGTGRTSKLSVARRALKSSLSAATRPGRIGMTGFGFRRRGTCRTSEIPVPVTAFNRQRLFSTLDRMNPRGRGPVAASLEAAGAQLKQHPAPRRILLIHDDPDNCGEDVCGIAKRLKTDMPDLVIETVSLRDPSEPKAMACLGRITGGQVVEATTPESATAAISAAVQRVLSAPTQRRPTPAKPPQQPKPTAERFEPGVHVQPGPRQLLAFARVTGVRAQTRADVLWTIQSEGAEGQTYQARGPSLRLPLPEGQYLVTAQADSFATRSQVRVVADRTSVLITEFDAVEVQVNPVLPKAEFGVSGSIVLRSANTELPYVIGRIAPHTRLLAPGAYVATASLGLARAERKFDAVLGVTTSVELPLQAGTIAVRNSDENGSPNQDRRIVKIIPGLEGSAEDNKTELARTTAPNPTFIVPAGPYQVVVETSSGQIERRVIVVPGARVTVRFDRTGGQLALRTRIAGRDAPEQDGVAYVIVPADRRAPNALRAHKAIAAVRLDPGRYTIESRLLDSGLTARRTVLVTPGMQETIVIEHNVGSLKLTPPPATAERDRTRIVWDIRDGNNARVWRDLGAGRTALLKPGRYRVLAIIDGRVRETQAQVGLGETSDVRF